MLRLAIATARLLAVVAAGVRGAQSPQTVTFPATGTAQQQNTTVVTLKRLSGIDQMTPR